MKSYLFTFAVVLWLLPWNAAVGQTAFREIMYTYDHHPERTIKIYIWPDPQDLYHYRIDLTKSQFPIYMKLAGPAIWDTLRAPDATLSKAILTLLRIQAVGKVRPDHIEDIREKVRRKAALAGKRVTPRKIYYFWRTDRECKIWFSKIDTSIYYLTRGDSSGNSNLEFAPQGFRQPSYLFQKDTLYTRIQRSMLFIANPTKTENLLDELANYLYYARPNDAFFEPYYPKSAFYFQVLPSAPDTIRFSVVYEDSMIAKGYFKYSGDIWYKNGLIPLEFFGESDNDGRSFFFKGYYNVKKWKNIQKLEIWFTLWNAWVNEFLKYPLSQKDHFYVKNDKYEWMWLEKVNSDFDLSAMLLPAMPAKPKHSPSRTRYHDPKTDTGAEPSWSIWDYGLLIAIVLAVTGLFLWIDYKFGLFNYRLYNTVWAKLVGRRRRRRRRKQQHRIVKADRTEFKIKLEQCLYSIKNNSNTMQAQEAFLTVLHGLTGNDEEVPTLASIISSEQNRLKKLFKSHKNFLRKSYDEITAENEDFVKELEKANKLNQKQTEQIDSLRQQLNDQNKESQRFQEKAEQIPGLKKQIDDLNKRADDYSEKLERAKSKAGDLKGQLEEARNEAREIAQKTRHEEKEKYGLRISELGQKIEKIEEEKKSEAVGFQQKINEEEARHIEERTALQAKHGEALENLQNLRSKEKDSYEEKITDLRNSHDGKIQTIRDEHADKIENLKIKYQSMDERNQDLEIFKKSYKTFKNHFTVLKSYVDLASFYLNDLESASAAGNVLALLNYSVFELLQTADAHEADSINKRRAMLVNIRTLASAYAEKYPTFNKVLEILQQIEANDPNAQKIETVDRLPSDEMNRFYRALFLRLCETTGIRFPRLYFAFPEQEGKDEFGIPVVESRIFLVEYTI